MNFSMIIQKKILKLIKPIKSMQRGNMLWKYEKKICKLITSIENKKWCTK